MPPTPQQRQSGPNAWKLQAANGSDIPCFGLTDRQVCIDDREFDFTFIIADVRQPILGADFLNRFYLAPNHRDRCLIDLNDWSEIPVGDRCNSHPNRVTNINLVDQKANPFYQTPRRLPDALHAVLHAEKRVARSATSHPHKLPSDTIESTQTQPREARHRQERISKTSRLGSLLSRQK